MQFLAKPGQLYLTKLVHGLEFLCNDDLFFGDNHLEEIFYDEELFFRFVAHEAKPYYFINYKIVVRLHAPSLAYLFSCLVGLRQMR